MPRFVLFSFVLILLIVSPVGAATPGVTTTSSVRAATPATPVRLEIGAIRLDEVLVTVGLNRLRQPIVPKHQVGWYKDSARPGQGENVVLWAHVLRWKDTPRVPAPFANLKALKIGAEIKVVMSNGREYRYQVTRKVLARPNQVEYILPVGSERLTLVSCDGVNMIVNGELTKEFRLITIARRIP